MWGLFGLDAKSQAEREATNLTGGRRDFNDWDLGDRFRSAITGVSKEDVLKRAQDIAADRINESNTTLRGDTRRALSGSGLEAGNNRIQLGETEAAFQDRLADDLSRGTAYKQLQALPGSENIEVSSDAQVSDLIGLARDAKKSEQGRVRTELQADRKDNRLHELTMQNTTLQAGRDQYNHQFRTQEARLAHTDRQNRLDRALERELNTSSSDLKMQLALMDQGLSEKRMEYDRETRRMDKRDRMIAQLMGSLGQLGSAF